MRTCESFRTDDGLSSRTEPQLMLLSGREEIEITRRNGNSMRTHRQVALVQHVDHIVLFHPTLEGERMNHFAKGRSEKTDLKRVNKLV